MLVITPRKRMISGETLSWIDEFLNDLALLISVSGLEIEFSKMDHILC